MPYTPLTPVASNPLNATYDGVNNADNTGQAITNPLLQKFIDNIHRVAKYRVANTAALSGLSGIQNNERVFVDGFGWYSYNSTSTSTIVDPFCIDGPSGVGRFFSDKYQFFDPAGTSADSKIAMVDGASGLLISATENQVLYEDGIYDGSPSPGQTASDSYVDIANYGLTHTKSFVIGDVFEFNVTGYLSATSGSGGSYGYIRPAFVINGTSYYMNNLEQLLAAGSAAVRFQFAGLARVTANGTTGEFKIQGKHTDATTSFVAIGNVSGYVKRIRNHAGAGYYNLV